MLNHSRSRPDSRPPFLHGLQPPPPPPHAAAGTEQQQLPRDRTMDPPSSSGRGPATPRRQLQGPRPPRLNVRMESHAIRKPSGSAGLAPAAAAQGAAPPRRERDDQQQQHAPAPPRAPVIIYDASPKVIHAKPSEFMAIVQSLTGPGSGAPQQQRQERHRRQADDDILLLDQAAAAFLPPELMLSPSAAMSPAARLATIERSVRPAPDHDAGVFPGADDGTLAAVLGPLARHPSILSPLPSALPPAAASGLFSPLPFDPTGISWLNELSPILRAASSAGPAASSSSFAAAAAASNGGSRAPPPAYYSDPFVPSPRNLLTTPTVPSPTAVAEFFGSLPDL
ncbi:transcription initiation factor TFIID subunit 4-like [Panicum virgatum]|uniref:VQ domain-containing protein n=1 Tax=Panicum virgatum TaxID=38727 RepID=A0A8T0QM64_PANVG|nr:transcription initiation factor TFIID subunit 4-like [Panicum virgatum]KAG2572066.1 hypothetical protein PVAP13_7KG146755 [Panicum virgatum]